MSPEDVALKAATEAVANRVTRDAADSKVPVDQLAQAFKDLCEGFAMISVPLLPESPRGSAEEKTE